MMTGVRVTADFAAIPAAQRPEKVEDLYTAMEAAGQDGRYARLTVERPWSEHNRVLEGQFAWPAAIRWYLLRELGRLAAAGARITVSPGRQAVDLHDPKLARALDETRWDLRRKKLFLFGPERMALSIDRLQHYTGTPAEAFQRYVLLTNYAWHVQEFRDALGETVGPDSDDHQMPAWHHVRADQTGLTMINIGVGPSNAKTITDHLAVLRPDLVLMIGHCAGLRNHQEIGDLVLASAYLRDDHVLDDMLPLSVPVTELHAEHAPARRAGRPLPAQPDGHRLHYRQPELGAGVLAGRGPPAAVPRGRGGHGVRDRGRQRFPLPDTDGHAARGQRQAAARAPQA